MEREEACDWYQTGAIRWLRRRNGEVILQSAWRRVIVTWDKHPGFSREMRYQKCEVEWRNVEVVEE